MIVGLEAHHGMLGVLRAERLGIKEDEQDYGGCGLPLSYSSTGTLWIVLVLALGGIVLDAWSFDAHY